MIRKQGRGKGIVFLYINKVNYWLKILLQKREAHPKPGKRRAAVGWQPT